MSDALDRIPDACETHYGLPQVDWKIVSAWVKQNVVEDDKQETWKSLSRAWINRLAVALGDGYSVAASGDFLLLASPQISNPAATAKSIEGWFARIRSFIPRVPKHPEYGHRIVIDFADAKKYYSHYAYFTAADGHRAGSGGVCIRSGYMHIALNSPPFAKSATIIHELVHLWVGDKYWPRWLEEGIARYLPQVFLGEQHFRIDRELVRRHKELWTSETIREFWAGSSFRRPDEGNELSYHLAELLIRRLMSDHPKQFQAFLDDAVAKDAGQSAAVAHFGMSLGALAASFLGPGDWEPVPSV